MKKMKKITIEEAKKIYGLETESEIILNIAKDKNVYQIFKCLDTNNSVFFVPIYDSSDSTEGDILTSSEIISHTEVYNSQYNIEEESIKANTNLKGIIDELYFLKDFLFFPIKTLSFIKNKKISFGKAIFATLAIIILPNLLIFTISFIGVHYKPGIMLGNMLGYILFWIVLTFGLAELIKYRGVKSATDKTYVISLYSLSPLIISIYVYQIIHVFLFQIHLYRNIFFWIGTLLIIYYIFHVNRILLEKKFSNFLGITALYLIAIIIIKVCFDIIGIPSPSIIG